jgi:hypothetical protein
VPADFRARDFVPWKNRLIARARRGTGLVQLELDSTRGGLRTVGQAYVTGGQDRFLEERAAWRSTGVFAVTVAPGTDDEGIGLVRACAEGGFEAASAPLRYSGALFRWMLGDGLLVACDRWQDGTCSVIKRSRDGHLDVTDTIAMRPFFELEPGVLAGHVKGEGVVLVRVDGAGKAHKTPLGTEGCQEVFDALRLPAGELVLNGADGALIALRREKGGWRRIGTPARGLGNIGSIAGNARGHIVYVDRFSKQIRALSLEESGLFKLGDSIEAHGGESLFGTQSGNFLAASAGRWGLLGSAVPHTLRPLRVHDDRLAVCGDEIVLPAGLDWSSRTPFGDALVFADQDGRTLHVLGVGTTPLSASARRP